MNVKEKIALARAGSLENVSFSGVTDSGDRRKASYG